MATPLARLAALFEGNDTHYGTHGEPSRDPNGRSKWIIRPTAVTHKGKVDDKLWKEHALQGSRKPLGIVPIRTDNTTIWGSIDYDVYDVELTDLIKKVEAYKLPLVPCRSKSGGLHLFMFVTEPIQSKTMQECLRALAAMLGVADSEIFPKQTTLLVDRGDQGSWMIMPYFGGDFGGKLKMQYGLRANGGEVSLSEFVRTAEKARQTPAQVEALIERAADPSPATSGSRKKASGGRGKKGSADEAVPLGDGPPCIVHIMRDGGPKVGTQNDFLFHVAVYLKKKYPETWTQELEKANATMLTPPGSQDGLDNVTRSLLKTDYQYKCKAEPMRSKCDLILCKKKTYGVSGGGGSMLPEIKSIAKMNSEPPIWFVEVEDGAAKIECSTEDLQQWPRFQRLLMEKLHNPFGVIAQPVWLQHVAAAMAEKVYNIEVSEDVKEGGVFLELLETYLTNRQRAESEEDLLAGRPWEDQENGRYYFQMSKLVRYLEREGLKNIKTPQVVSMVRKLNGITDPKEACYENREIKGKTVRVHFVPSSVVQATPKISTPAVKGKPI